VLQGAFSPTPLHVLAYTSVALPHDYSAASNRPSPAHRNTQAIIYVVDSCDADRLPTSREEFSAILEEEELRDAAILVYANKQVGRRGCWCHKGLGGGDTRGWLALPGFLLLLGLGHSAGIMALPGWAGSASAQPLPGQGGQAPGEACTTASMSPLARMRGMSRAPT
jgi:hypothetical protein